MASNQTSLALEQPRSGKSSQLPAQRLTGQKPALTIGEFEANPAIKWLLVAPVVTQTALTVSQVSATARGQWCSRDSNCSVVPTGLGNAHVMNLSGAQNLRLSSGTAV